MKNRMKELRFFKNLTLDDIWLKTRIHAPKLSRIERGILEPKADERKRIAEALGEPEKIVFPLY